METSGVILFYEKCRLCLDKPGTTNIFQKDGLKQDIFHCTGVKVSDKESLPEKICAQCLEIIYKAKHLRVLAAKNDSYLKTLFCDDDTLELPALEDQTSAQDTQLDSSTFESIVNASEPLPSSKKDSRSSPKENRLQIRKDLFPQFQPASTSTPVAKVVDDRSQRSGKRKAASEIVETDSNYRCETCDKSFDTHKKLYHHKMQHEKKHMCPLDACGKKFATKGDLEKHLRTHTGVKPFSCDICEKKFAQMVTLRSHKENVHYCFTHILK